jgi:hypothetical protein
MLHPPDIYFPERLFPLCNNSSKNKINKPILPRTQTFSLIYANTVRYINYISEIDYNMHPNYVSIRTYIHEYHI